VTSRVVRLEEEEDDAPTSGTVAAGGDFTLLLLLAGDCEEGTAAAWPPLAAATDSCRSLSPLRRDTLPSRPPPPLEPWLLLLLGASRSSSLALTHRAHSTGTHGTSQLRYKQGKKR